MADKINVVVLSGERERLQMAAMMASVGAVSGSEVNVFLSMNAMPHFVKGASEDAPCGGKLGELMKEKDVIGFMTLFEQAVTLGEANIYACSMAMDVLGVSQDDLEEFVTEPLGLTKFMDIAREGQTWTF
jgi:peroxiredoxin family protein